MSLKLFRRGKTWHYAGTVAGRRLRKSTGTEDKKTAQRIADAAAAKAWRSHLDGPEAHVTMAQAAIAYRDAGKPDRFLELIEDYWKDTPISDMTAGGIKASARKLYPGVSAATMNRQVIVPTVAIINHAAELGWCSHIKVKRFSEETKERRPVTLEWVLAFQAQAEKDDLPHLAALCVFMFGTGARRGEACALTWSAIDLEAAKATINSTKVKLRRNAHLPPQVVAALANIPSNRKPENPVFKYASGESVGQVWGNVIERAGIEHLPPHSCRHGFATTMLHQGIDPVTIAKRGGWKDVATVLKHYAHALEDETVTDVIFGTKLTQGRVAKPLACRKTKGKSL